MESLKVIDYMNNRPVLFTTQMSLTVALERLLQSRQTGGPVVNEKDEVIGFISEQDMIQKLLKVSYHCEDAAQVGDCMRTDVLSVDPNDSILALAEMMCGQKPKVYPVVEKGRLVGVITRRNVLDAIHAQILKCFQHPV
ncbi:hypothetical protein VST7929_01392 [Vibrio stylophorae]|uniref:CBS domain-containing protein n=1 Tax=Vibrio stylophorae TaxID=659351 RepID=A0ABM8ZT73_9VIBR|nr:CBS domain-containing protein [Vibrio stylophorae]CAH0533522.1 hypothetical protein VST7929_01392 [Vibrio stylophorae]